MPPVNQLAGRAGYEFAGLIATCGSDAGLSVASSNANAANELELLLKQEGHVCKDFLMRKPTRARGEE